MIKLVPEHITVQHYIHQLPDVCTNCEKCGKKKVKKLIYWCVHSYVKLNKIFSPFNAIKRKSYLSLSSLIRSNFFSTSWSGSSSSSLNVFYKTPTDLNRKQTEASVPSTRNLAPNVPAGCQHTVPETPPGAAPLCWAHSEHFLPAPEMTAHPAAARCTSYPRWPFSAGSGAHCNKFNL